MSRMDIPMTVTIPDADADVTLMAPDEQHPRIDLIIGRKVDSFPHFGITDLRVITGIAAQEPYRPDISRKIEAGFEIVHIVRIEPHQ